jgi:hypothetical protein
MRPITSRTLVVLTSLALLAGATGFGSLASAESNGPTVVLASTSGTTTSAMSIPVTVTFSEPVNGYTATGVNASNATVSGFTGSGASYSFDLVPNSAGTVTVQVNADQSTAVASPSLRNQPSNVLTFTATNNPPVVSGISVSPADTTATITWNTDAPSNGQVSYGSTSSYDAQSTFDTAMSTSHTAYLGGLVPNSTYHFAVVSGNGHGTTSSADQTFTTTASGSTNTGGNGTTTTPLAFTGADAVNASATADGTFGNGWKWVLHFTVPDTETSFQLKFGNFTNSASGSIPAGSNIRYSSAQSSNAGDAASAIVESDNGYGGAMTLTGDTSSTTPGRQIDVTVEVSVPSGTPTGSYSTTFGALSQ